jgi:hypothetical protein
VNTNELAADVASCRSAGIPDEITAEIVTHAGRLAPGGVTQIAREMYALFSGQLPGHATLTMNIARSVESLAVGPSGSRIAPAPSAAEAAKAERESRGFFDSVLDIPSPYHTLIKGLRQRS